VQIPLIKGIATAGITQPLHPHLFRHQMLTYLTSKGLTDAQIQLISGHESKKSLACIAHKSLRICERCRLVVLGGSRERPVLGLSFHLRCLTSAL
jgi:integrase